MLYQKATQSTRQAFFIAGFALASWAPLIPLTKQRLNLEEGRIGTVLLAFGLGSLLMMPLSGSLAARYGARKVFCYAFISILLTLPALTMISSFPLLMLVLFLFGAGIGAMDVVVNIHAVHVEKHLKRPIMSGMHALFSLGGLIGAGTVSLLLSLNLIPILCIFLVMVLLGIVMLRTQTGLLKIIEKDDAPLFVLPQGKVIFLGIFCCIAYLVEGSMLDWSGILLNIQYHLPLNQAGLGYTAFAITMTIGRFLGDFTIKRLGEKNVFFGSSLATLIGLILLVSSTQLWGAILAFLIIGLGISNLAPLLFTASGQQEKMSDTAAVAAVSTMGYTGILLGPALIGGLAHMSSISTAFMVIGTLFLLLTISAFIFKIKI